MREAASDVCSIAHERVATKQAAGKAAAARVSTLIWQIRAPSAVLLALRICESYSTRLAPCIRGHLVRNAAHEGFCISLLARLYDFAEQFLFQRIEECQLALARRDIADRLLQRKDALWALERIEAQTPVDHLEHIVGVTAGPDLLRRHEMVLRQPGVRGLRRKSGKAGEHARADAVHVGPGPQPVWLAILLRSGEAGCVHRRELRTRIGQCLPRRAEVEQHG